MRISDPFKSRMWWQGPLPGEFRADVFFCFARLICSCCAEAVSPCEGRAALGWMVQMCPGTLRASTPEGSGYEPDGEVLPKAAAVP